MMMRLASIRTRLIPLAFFILLIAILIFFTDNDTTIGYLSKFTNQVPNGITIDAE